MKDEIKIVNCGCGGEASVDYFMDEPSKGALYAVYCRKCEIHTMSYDTMTAAIQAWNCAMGAKDINVPNKFATDTNVGNKTEKFKQDGEFLRCGKCNHIVDSGYKYCPECGSRLEFE